MLDLRQIDVTLERECPAGVGQRVSLMKCVLAGRSHVVCHLTVWFHLQNPCNATNSDGNEFSMDKVYA